MLITEDFFFKKAIDEAITAMDRDEVPIGVIIVCNGKIIAKAHNQVEMLQDVTAHGEILAITAASNYLGTKFLDNCEMYVTLEPCPMCIGAIRHARISKLTFGAYEQKKWFEYDIIKLLPHTKVTGGFREKECETFLKEFFKKKRG